MTRWFTIIGAGALAGCAAAPPAIPRFIEPALQPSETRPDIPEACYGRGQVGEIEMWFETVCDDVLDATLIRAVQRSLKVRGLMDGPVSGRLDSATRQGVRAFQQDLGVTSDRLSVAGAKRLGLLSYERADLPGG